jgi:hypothetical protein
MKDLLSAPIDTLVQDSDKMKHLFEEIQPQLLEVLQIRLRKSLKSSSGRLDIFFSFGPKWKKLIVGSKHVAHRPP